MAKKFFAHSLPGKPPKEWQLLDEHLKNVAKMTDKFAQPFCGGTWAQLLGRNHDIGKGTFAWQAFLRHENGIIDEFVQYYEGRVEHSAQGGKWLYGHSKEAGKLLAYCISGHHGGLPNWSDSPESALKNRLEKSFSQLEIRMDTPELPEKLTFAVPDVVLFGFQLQLFVRMLFSCLVDADYLDTEAFIDEKKAGWRSKFPLLQDLRDTFWINFDRLRNNAKETVVNRQREIVLSDCLRAANEEEGLFSLTVPTGGGKTLASLAFAFEHAQKHDKRRIIYVIPFTSIVEQNAAVFRDMLGDDAVLEHHCNFIPDDANWKTRLSAENWDAPIVVTTNGSRKK